MSRKNYSNGVSYLIPDGYGRMVPYWTQSKRYLSRPIAHPKKTPFVAPTKSKFKHKVLMNWNDKYSNHFFYTAKNPKKPAAVSYAIHKNKKMAMKRLNERKAFYLKNNSKPKYVIKK